MIAQLCAQRGVRHAVVSPGSRNAPLMIAFNRQPEIKCHVIVDERSAAFYALGIAQQLSEPVVLICTSGTALLNYAPGVAEAFYQRIPLLVLSADRPTEWIDQDDSQTIRQYGVFDSFVKSSYQLPIESEKESDQWYVNRCVNEAINLSCSGRRGPVHLNIPLDDPLCVLAPVNGLKVRVFEKLQSSGGLSVDQLMLLGQRVCLAKKVMIVASQYQPNSVLERTLRRLSERSNVVVLTETIANLRADQFIACIDRTISCIPSGEDQLYMPDILISFGGALISKMIKSKLKEASIGEHWYIGSEDLAIDTFCCLSLQVDLNPALFFEQLESIIAPDQMDSSFASIWGLLDRVADTKHLAYISEAQWSDLKAFSVIVPSLPLASRLQLSNGTSVRYHQLFKGSNAIRVDANRGTSGIDGSTSTAAGAASVYDGMTILISGDLSFLYDSNALWNNRLATGLKIIVLNNGGGGIFRFLKGPSDLEEMEPFFETPHQLELQRVAHLYGIGYVCASNEKELRVALGKLYASSTCAMLEVRTPREVNDRVLRGYFNK